MEPEAFEYALNSAYEYIYNNESELAPLQYPLAMSRYITPKFANDLYTDNANQYFTYSGTGNSLIVTKEKDGRYKNLTLRAYSGDSFKFYFQAGSGITDSELYFSGPLTTSGVYSTMTQYTTQSGALANSITFSAPTNNSSVYTLPSIQNLNWIRLYHRSTNGVTPYRIYQFLPRTLIQVDDLEADVIDVVSLRVSGSIVVTADNLANGSITGAKIMAGTVSGVLITPGTITANEISAGTITANKLNVTQLDAVAANMGTLVVNSGISIGTGGTIWAGAGSASTPTTGLKIYTTSGVSRLTTFSGGIAQVDIGSDGKLYVGSGQTLRLDSTGITLKPSVSGVTLFQISTPPAISTYEIRPPISNLIKYKPFYYQTDASNTTTFYDYTSDIYSFSVGANQTFLKDGLGGVVDNDTYDGIDAKIRVGWLASESGAAGYHKIHNSSLSITSKGDTNSSLLIATPANKVQMDKNGVTISGYSLSGNGVTIQANTTITGDVTTSGDIAVAGNIHAGLGDHMFTVNGTTGNLHVGAPPHVFTVNGSSGNTTISGNLSVGPEPHVFKVNSSTGNVTVSGTLNVTGATTTTGNTAIAGTLGVTGQTTLGALNASGAVGFGTSNNKVTIAASTGDTLIAGTLGVTGDVTTTNNVNVGGSLQTTYGVLAKTQLSAAYDNVSAYRFTVGSTGDIYTEGAIFAGAGNSRFTVTAAAGNTAIAGTLGVTGLTTLGALTTTSTLTASANVLQYNYGGLYKNTAQSVAAGADAKITFQVAYTNGTLDSIANSRLTTTYAGFYVISAGVIGNQTGNTWQVVTGGAFGTGVLLAGIIQADMRAYVTKIVYLAAGTNLEIYVRNTGAAILAVTTGTTGTVLSAAKVG